jgi:DNA replication protein DnaD
VAGWLSVQRKFFKSSFWEEKRTFSKAEAWLDLLALAAWKDTEIIIGMNTLKLERGQIHTSNRFLSKRWNRSLKWVHVFLNFLSERGQITKKESTQGTTICITNYEKYQSFTDEEETPRKHFVPRGGNAEETPRKRGGNKEEQDNKITSKQVNKSVTFPSHLDTEQCKEVWAKWLEFRKTLTRKPLLIESQELQLSRFLSPEHLIATIRESRTQSWTGLFPEHFDAAGLRIGRSSGTNKSEPKPYSAAWYEQEALKAAGAK